MYHRSLSSQNRSFFLFGPRGTGKTVWLHNHMPHSHYIDLNSQDNYLKYLANPSVLSQEAAALPPETWIVIGEVQKIPQLLDEVHAIMNRQPQLKFALTGSSTRKLRASGINLLAGRAVNRKMFCFTGQEVNYDFDINERISLGFLPICFDEARADAIDVLKAYQSNYIEEEIRKEAQLRRLDSFARFLRVSALAHGQVTNLAGIARDSQVPRNTVRSYFQILEETLLGFWLPAWQKKLRIKEQKHPKFYFFDPAVVLACRDQLGVELEESTKGFLFETIVLNELRAHSHYLRVSEIFYYWQTPSKAEVDVIWQGETFNVGFEIKWTSTWRKGFSKILNEMVDAGHIRKAFGVYNGPNALKDGHVHVLPIKEFMAKVACGDIFGG